MTTLLSFIIYTFFGLMIFWAVSAVVIFITAIIDLHLKVKLQKLRYEVKDIEIKKRKRNGEPLTFTGQFCILRGALPSYVMTEHDKFKWLDTNIFGSTYIEVFKNIAIMLFMMLLSPIIVGYIIYVFFLYILAIIKSFTGFSYDPNRVMYAKEELTDVFTWYIKKSSTIKKLQKYLEKHYNNIEIQRLKAIELNIIRKKLRYIDAVSFDKALI